MLLNLSNHPSSTWPENQITEAKKQFQAVRDLPFPQIDPNWDKEKVAELVDEFDQQIQSLNPKAVHIMGEMTFTYRLVHRLKEIGIPCIASTTNRRVTEKDSVKTSVFEFVRFRSY